MPPIIGTKIVIIMANGILIAYIKANIPIIINPLLAKFNNTSVYKAVSYTHLDVYKRQMPFIERISNNKSSNEPCKSLVSKEMLLFAMPCNGIS